MAGKNTGVSTRSKGAIKFSGLPSPLDKTEPRTCRKIIQYSYFLMNTYPQHSCLGISKLIAKDVIDIWKAVNPRLPLLKEISVVNKVKILCFQKAKQISRKHLPATQTMKISPPIASTLYVQGDSSHSYSSSPSDETEDYKQLESPLQVPYNLKKILWYALQLVRGDIFSNLGASLAHALLLDLRAIGLFIPNIDIKNIYMDKCKIKQRLKGKQMPMKSIMKMWRIFFV